ncbi:uncharacterized protein LOC119114794 [Pollicipes pollicipes]|uniref:uncharacterized protein LOC119114794 n=1 Tax=Pollicipes pollicipes TaxID=41117 RepID=UPI00188534A8|nr:uncharacterized protein LOC119114794 [Pollicipes pollicipes]
MKDSDADFNLGLAMGALQTLQATGNSRVYVAMNGLVCPCESMERDPETGQFLPCRRPRSRDLGRPRSAELAHQRSLDSLLDTESAPSINGLAAASAVEQRLERRSTPEPRPEPQPRRQTPPTLEDLLEEDEAGEARPTDAASASAARTLLRRLSEGGHELLTANIAEEYL